MQDSQFELLLLALHDTCQVNMVEDSKYLLNSSGQLGKWLQSPCSLKQV